jgi:transcriptional regulator with XRE-family HTH domain
MLILAENLRHLRAQKKLSQQKVADELGFERARLAKYEENKADPPVDVLQRIAKYYHVSIDIIISVNLKNIPLDSLLKLADNRILLPITVDKQNRDNIEIIPHKAKAGYLTGYSDPEFIVKLQQMHLPFLKSGKHRAFPIEGDSMPPLRNGSFVVGRYVEVNDIVDGRTYIVLSRTEGIVYKRVHRKSKKDNLFAMHSDNPVYQPYDMKANDILEVWEFQCSINTKEFEPDDLNYESIRDMLRQLRIEIRTKLAT